MSKPKWPAEVPVLTARDIHRGALDGPNQTHCLIGWCSQSFDDFDVWDTAREKIAGRIGDGRAWISDFNDDPATTKAEIARVWNLAMADLGYTEGNPEAPKAKVKK
jgi:hypothetical protein